jgi:hypothetical protein
MQAHRAPHVHARYGEHRAKVSIVTGEVIEGSLPRRAARLVAEWVSGTYQRTRGMLEEGNQWGSSDFRGSWVDGGEQVPVGSAGVEE